MHDVEILTTDWCHCIILSLHLPIMMPILLFLPHNDHICFSTVWPDAHPCGSLHGPREHCPRAHTPRSIAQHNQRSKWIASVLFLLLYKREVCRLAFRMQSRSSIDQSVVSSIPASSWLHMKERCWRKDTELVEELPSDYLKSLSWTDHCWMTGVVLLGFHFIKEQIHLGPDFWDKLITHKQQTPTYPRNLKSD